MGVRRSIRISAIILALLVFAARLHAQGVQAGMLEGRVTTPDGLSLPGATVVAVSPALQGERSAVTDVNGVYQFPGLPPGEYALTFTMDAMAAATERAHLALGATVTVNRVMQLAQVAETIVVTAAAPSPLGQVAVASNVRAREVNQLPIGRTPYFVAELMPGLTANTPTAAQVTIGGAFAYDNVFLVNGVDVNDNVAGTANAVFIEDAIEETQVLTSALPAEYGRFSGGVVNLVTRSGGNLFSGSYRTTLSNPAWSDETRLEDSRGVTRASKLSTYHEGTVGGPILRDRLWFFGAGRLERSTTASVFAQTAVPYTSEVHNTRYEAKLTATVAPAQTLQGSYIQNTNDLKQPSLPFSIDPATFGTPSTPNRLFVTSYKGVLADRFYATAQYSMKKWRLEHAGGTQAAIVDSPFLTRTGGQYQYNAQYFDGTDPEERNNEQFAGSVSYFAARRGFGSHELKGGAERFTSTRVGGNSQTPTGYVFLANYRVNASGVPALDANGRLVPTFVPGVTAMQAWMPLRGAQIDVHTTSAYVGDHWLAGGRWSFDVGARYEQVSTDATAVSRGVDAQTLVPRLGASVDLTGNGRTILQAFYGHYAGKYNDAQFARNSNVGNADRTTNIYTGPAGEGRDFAAGFTPANYTTVAGTFPTANVSFDPDLKSPLTREFVLGINQEVTNGSVRAAYTWRRLSNAVDDIITRDNGTTTVVRNGVTFGTFDNVVYRNTDLAMRRYQAVQASGTYRVRPNWTVNGSWTVQIENDGNFEGEAPGSPASPSMIGDYPEVFVASRTFPSGHLDDFQRHKIRVWSVYALDAGRFGSFDIAPLWRYNSGTTYSLVATGVPLSAWQVAQNPGYARTPNGGTQTLFFGERGSQFFDGYGLVDLAVTYGVPAWKSMKPWVKVEVLNALNNQELVSWDTTIAVDPASAKDAFGLPTGYVKGARFGQATSNGNYARPRPGLDGGRTVFVAIGARF